MNEEVSRASCLTVRPIFGIPTLAARKFKWPSSIRPVSSAAPDRALIHRLFGTGNRPSIFALPAGWTACATSRASREPFQSTSLSPTFILLSLIQIFLQTSRNCFFFLPPFSSTSLLSLIVVQGSREKISVDRFEGWKVVENVFVRFVTEKPVSQITAIIRSSYHLSYFHKFRN